MKQTFDRVIKITFYFLFSIVPLIFYPFTSELFEFNKIVLVYLGTVLITTSWLCKIVIERKFLFRRTILDIPLILFLFSQLVSTFLSIDFHTSLFGYYSRFNGGLISSFCYVFLYWAFVSNINKTEIKKYLYSFVASASLVSVYAFFEHFGKSFSCFFVTGQFNVACWKQDVTNRVFATIGQPNWLAAWIVALIPITWMFWLNLKNKNQKILLFLISNFFFLILLYTKSRSGLLGFAAEVVIFWSLVFIKNKKDILKSFSYVFISILVIAGLVGTPWTPSILNKKDEPKKAAVGPALETGGTESGEIRKIVWKGAIDVWKHYPLTGSGVETFAFSYNQFRPVEHNLVSEWDYVYNKAHNEYLNFAATTGTLGSLSYLSLIISIIYLLFRNLKNKSDNYLTTLAISAGFTSILVTNFFGFSVVVTSLLFFLFPAFSVVENEDLKEEKVKEINNIQKLMITTLLVFGCYVFYSTLKYWYADVLFARAQVLNRSAKFTEARGVLAKSIKISPNEAVYLNEVAIATANIASGYHETEAEKEAKTAAQLFDLEIQKAIVLSHRNLNIKRNASSLYTKLSSIDSSFLVKANSILIDSEELAPTDPRTKLNLAGSFIRLGDKQKAETLLRQVVSLKPDYKEGRYALAAVLADQGKKDEAIENLNYILKKVDPLDKNFQELLEDIEKQ